MGSRVRGVGSMLIVTQRTHSAHTLCHPDAKIHPGYFRAFRDQEAPAARSQHPAGYVKAHSQTVAVARFMCSQVCNLDAFRHVSRVPSRS